MKMLKITQKRKGTDLEFWDNKILSVTIILLTPVFERATEKVHSSLCRRIGGRRVM